MPSRSEGELMLVKFEHIEFISEYLRSSLNIAIISPLHTHGFCTIVNSKHTSGQSYILSNRVRQMQIEENIYKLNIPTADVRRSLGE